MKNELIEKSIIFPGYVRPGKNTFSAEGESDKKSRNYQNIRNLSGRKLSVTFEYKPASLKVVNTNESISGKTKFDLRDAHDEMVKNLTAETSDDTQKTPSPVKEALKQQRQSMKTTPKKREIVQKSQIGRAHV